MNINTKILSYSAGDRGDANSEIFLNLKWQGSTVF
jgi:hypothetical protein